MLGGERRVKRETRVKLVIIILLRWAALREMQGEKMSRCRIQVVNLTKICRGVCMREQAGSCEAWMLLDLGEM